MRLQPVSQLCVYREKSICDQCWCYIRVLLLSTIRGSAVLSLDQCVRSIMKPWLDVNGQTHTHTHSSYPGTPRLFNLCHPDVLCFKFFAVISVCFFLFFCLFFFFFLKNRCEPEIFPVFFYFSFFPATGGCLHCTKYSFWNMFLFFQNVWILKTIFCPCVNLRAEFQIF